MGIGTELPIDIVLSTCEMRVSHKQVSPSIPAFLLKVSAGMPNKVDRRTDRSFKQCFYKAENNMEFCT